MFYDVRFDAIAPKSADSAEQEEVIRLIINVEAQTKFKPGYLLTKRAIYYCSRMISAQHGPIFTKSEFGKYDVVHIHAEGPAFFAWLPKMFGKRVVVTVHGIDLVLVKYIGLYAAPVCRQVKLSMFKASLKLRS